MNRVPHQIKMEKTAYVKKIEHSGGDGIDGDQRAELLVGASESIHERIIEHRLKIYRSVDCG